MSMKRGGEKKREMQKDLTIKMLTYARAYKNLLRYIHKNYWALKKDPAVRESGFNSEQLPLYQAVEGGQHFDDLYRGSGSEGKIRLNALLKNIWVTQNTSADGCIVLLRWIKASIEGKGHHLPGQLARAVVGGIFKVPESASADFPCKIFNGDTARKMNEEIAALDKLALSHSARYRTSEDVVIAAGYER